MTRILTAFHSGPQAAHGYARDMRVRWALEEAGLSYRTRTIDFASRAQGFAAGQPFGQIPSYDDGEVRMFESGAIVLEIAAESEALLPRDRAGRARAVSWLFAALNTVEPVTWAVVMNRVLKPDWAEAAAADLAERAHDRLQPVADALGDGEWLEGRFTAGDLMMVSVFRHAALAGLLDPYPNLGAYLARGEARPAFRRALAANEADFRD